MSRPRPCNQAARAWLIRPNIAPMRSSNPPNPIDRGTERPNTTPPMTARPILTATVTMAPTDIVRASRPRVERAELSAREGTVRATSQVARAAIQAPRMSRTATAATEVAMAGPSPLTGADTTSASLVRSF